MAKLQYNLVALEDQQHITVVVDGEMYVADSSNPQWQAIVQKVLSGTTDGLATLFSPAKAVESKFTAITERVSVLNGVVLFDGDPVDNALTKQIIRFYNEGLEDWKPLVNFMEKVQTNPSQNSREQLYEFLARHEIAIHPDGDVIGYKSVKKDRNVDGNGYLSVSAGSAYVNGQRHDGQIPQKIGDIVTMPRSDVASDTNVACSTGLHVGSYRYVSEFFRHDAILLVKFNPRDVVSVPTDSNWEKVRVCRYEIVEADENELTSAIYAGKHRDPLDVTKATPYITDTSGWEDDDDDEDDSWSWDDEDSWSEDGDDEETEDSLWNNDPYQPNKWTVGYPTTGFYFASNDSSWD